MVNVRALSGFGSIGGNFIRIEDQDRVLVFDQGIRFDVMSNYYSWLASPRGLTELRELGAIPKPEWYEGASAVYITHMHLDHLGLLSNIPFETEVCLPSLLTYKDMEERWMTSPSWLSLLPGKYYLKFRELKPLRTDRNGVMAIPVSHSAYPAYALLYFGSNRTVLYTGDFRIEGFLTSEEVQTLRGGMDVLAYLRENPDVKVDTLIIEGTNVGSSGIPLAPEEALGIIRRLTSAHTLVVTSLHGLDLEYAYALLRTASALGLCCYVASTWIAKLLERGGELPPEPKLIEEYVGYPALLKKVGLEEVEESALILVSHREVVDFLRDMHSYCKKLAGSVVAILSEPEPEREEASGYDVIANWLSTLGIQHYRVRVSGHYYPYQLKAILEGIKPKEILAIHTANPSLLYMLAQRYGIKSRST